MNQQKRRPPQHTANQSVQNRTPRDRQAMQSRPVRPNRNRTATNPGMRTAPNRNAAQRRSAPMQNANTMARSTAQAAQQRSAQQRPMQQKPLSSTSAKKRVQKRAEKRQAPPRRLTHGELRRRRRRRNLLLAFLTVIVIGVGIALSLTVLFKVEEFRVENLDKTSPANTGIYTEEQVLSALRISVGDKMFQFSAKDKQKALEVELPYLDVVQIRRSLPGTVVVRVQPAVETWCVQTDGSWLILSDSLKVLKITQEKPEHLTALTGLAVNTPVEGYSLQLQDERKHQELLELIAVLEKYGMKSDCTEIALGEENNAYVIYQDRAKILIGTYNNLDYKIQFASVIMQNKDGKGVAESERGVLDVSHQLEDGSIRPTWSPGEFAAVESTEPTEPATDTAESQDPAASQTEEGQQAQDTEQTQETQTEETQTDGADGQDTTPQPTTEPAD